MAKPKPIALNALEKWLNLTWERPERSYNPDLREFLAALLEYPKELVVTEDRAGGGFADLKLLTEQKLAWVVGDLKKDDAILEDADKCHALWLEKKRYVDGLTRYVLFVTPCLIWVGNSLGEPVHGAALELKNLTLEELQEYLKFLNYSQANHNALWKTFTSGTLPFSYLDLHEADATRQLRDDLTKSFGELTDSATRAFQVFEDDHNEYKRVKQEIEKQLGGNTSAKRRALVRLNIKHQFVRHLFEESLPQFEEQYGRQIEGTPKAIDERLREAFLSDSVAALTARVLFLRLIEDLGLTKKRRLSNGGPKNWDAFVETLTGDAKALIRVASEDAARLYKEPFEQTVFDWINHANGELDESLQRLVLRLNAYNFQGLNEELLGDIYQQFLPISKRKRLGEFYTPPSIVDWILQETVQKHGEGSILDPSCGSGSFLVRYAHWRLANAQQRQLEPSLVRQELQDELWGFDLNPFAAFISYFQMIWALLRYHPKGNPPHIHVYNLNSLLRDEEYGASIGADLLPPGSAERDSKKWKYIIGNPPYIRAERIKYADEAKTTWADVWGQNADTGLVFLYRSIKEWLEPGGFLGMVVSGGYASSEAAAKVWKLLHPNGQASLRKIVWLEFIEDERGKNRQVWDAARVPLILIIENTPPKAEDEIEILTPRDWWKDAPEERSAVQLESTKVKYADFWDKKVNPKVTDTDTSFGAAYPWGDYLLPLIQQNDVKIMQKITVTSTKLIGSAFQTRGAKSAFTYGIQRGGVEVSDDATGTNPRSIIAGRSVAIATPGNPQGWIDLEAVAKRPNGKLSLWSKNNTMTYVAIPEIALSLSAALIRSSEYLNVAAVNSLVVAEVNEKQTRAEIAVSIINSSLIRFLLHTKFRSGVIQGFYAHFYPRTLEALPFPAKLSPDLEQRLVTGYLDLERLAAVAKNSPKQWFLDASSQALNQGSHKITANEYGLSFADWGEDVLVSELELDDTRLRAGLFSVGFNSHEVASYVHTVLTENSDEDSKITKKLIQQLLIPKNLSALMLEYAQRLAAFGNVQQDFMAALNNIDQAVYAAFNLTTTEREYIEQRLSSFPLNRLTPRYPWDTVSTRGIKAYLEDRFA